MSPKVYALHVGDTKVPYGQFYGGMVGPKGIWKLFRDKMHYIVVPIYVYLIDHPTAGLVLIDAGINCEQVESHRQYYPGRMAKMMLDEDEYLMTKEQELSSRVSEVGYRYEDIKMVVVTHMHEDHTGGLRTLRHAKTVLAADEWNGKALGYPLKKSPSVKDIVTNPQLVRFTSGPFHSFDHSEDLFGDGSVVLVPTPGHSPGHLAAIVRMDGYQLLCGGDTLYALRHLDVDQVRPVATSKKNWEKQVDSIRRLHRLRDALPDLVVLPAHDHTAYADQHVRPFLADGTLSPEERDAIRSYEAHVFERRWRVAPHALPDYIPAADGGVVGTVAEPMDWAGSTSRRI